MQTRSVRSFHELISTPFESGINAIGWIRETPGDFSEIVHKIQQDGNITVIDEECLAQLELSDQGALARTVLLSDLHLLKESGASPVLNLVRNYDRDDVNEFFPTDVYSYHVDRSPVPTDTFLCTYYGEPSEILPGIQAEQKVLVPEIRNKLRQLYNGPEDGFESFIRENFFDLHYQAKAGAKPISLGTGHIWKLAVDHPENKVLPCVHRAPEEKGVSRLLMIC